MTPGEHSGRGYGRDDHDYSSYYGQQPAHERHPEPPWGVEQSWPGQPDHQGWTGQPDHQGWSAQPDRQDWSGPQHWSGQPDWSDPQGRSGQQAWPAGSGDAWQGEPAHPYRDSGDPYQDRSNPYGDHTDTYQGEALPAGGWHHGAATGAWQRPVTEPGATGADGGFRGDGSRGDGRRGDGRRGRERRRGLPLWQEVPLLLVIAFCLALLVRTFLLQAFYIPSGSMEETLIAGDRVLVNKVVYNVREPARGEVVVFRGTEAWSPQHALDTDIGMFTRVGRAVGELVGISRPTEKDYIKRIIGLPGDRVSCCDVEGRVFVNGQPLDEDYITFNAPLNDAPEGGHDCRSRRFDEVVVEPGQMFVLGDHRAISQDSRCQGQVPIDNVIGRAFVIVWPSARWTSLPAPDTFSAVPQATAEQPVAEQVTTATDPATGRGSSEAALVLPLLLSAAAAGRGERAS